MPAKTCPFIFYLLLSRYQIILQSVGLWQDEGYRYSHEKYNDTTGWVCLLMPHKL